MSVDLEHRDIYSRTDPEVKAGNVVAVGEQHVLIYAEENGDFMVSVSVKKCDLDPARMHIVTINKEMLAAMNAAQQ